MPIEIFDGSEWVSAPEPGPTFAVSRETHTYAIAGPANSTLLPFYVSVHPGETLKLVEVIGHAGVGSDTFDISINHGIDPELLGFTIDTSPRVATLNTPISLSDRDYLLAWFEYGLVADVTITLVLERTSPVVEE